MRAVHVAPLLLPLLPLFACAGMEGDLETSVETAEVVGGTNAPAGKWPDVAAVNFAGQQGCTGTLIAPTVVMTAGHCNDTDLDSVLIGTTALNRPAEGEKITVMRKIEYPNSFNSADITVLVLATPSTKTPRALATGWARFDIKNGAQVAIVGYGAVDRDANMFKNELQEAMTTITDFDCTLKPGCNAPVQPGGELGAGGMGIDTCPGDSGGPLYLVTDYGTFLAGVTSRAYDDAMFPCTEGGIYGRPDKFVDWIEMQAGVKVARGPEPTAEAITAMRGSAGETMIVHNDPKSQSHTFTVATPPGHATVKVRDDGLVRVCAEAGVAGDDTMVVTVADTVDPTRKVDVRISLIIENGAEAGEDCDVNDFGGGEEGGGCCDSGRSAGGALPLALGVLVILGRRRRRSQ